MKPNPSKSPSPARSSQAQSFLQKGETSLGRSLLEPALRDFRKACELFQKSGESLGLARSLLRQGRVLELMGEYPRATTTYQDALKQFLQLGDKEGIARTKGFLGNVGWATGDYSDAARLMAESLFLFQEMGDIHGQAWAHDLIGNLKLAMRDDQEAERSYLASHGLVEGPDMSPESKAWHFFHRGALELYRENPAQAQAYFAEALGIFVKTGDDLGQVAARIHLGEVACGQKDYPTAQSHFQKAVELVIPTACRPLLMDTLTGVAQLLKGQGQERKAIGILMVALSHPTCRQQTKDRMVSMVIQLETRFTTQEIKGGFSWAREVTIEQMAQSWVASLTGKDKPQKTF